MYSHNVDVTPYCLFFSKNCVAGGPFVSLHDGNNACERKQGGELSCNYDKALATLVEGGSFASCFEECNSNCKDCCKDFRRSYYNRGLANANECSDRCHQQFDCEGVVCSNGKVCSPAGIIDESKGLCAQNFSCAAPTTTTAKIKLAAETPTTPAAENTTAPETTAAIPTTTTAKIKLAAETPTTPAAENTTAPETTAAIPPPTSTSVNDTLPSNGKADGSGGGGAVAAGVTVPICLLITIAVTMFCMRKKEQARQRALTRGAGNMNRVNNRMYDAANVHDNAGQDDGTENMKDGGGGDPPAAAASAGARGGSSIYDPPAWLPPEQESPGYYSSVAAAPGTAAEYAAPNELGGSAVYSGVEAGDVAAAPGTAAEYAAPNELGGNAVYGGGGGGGGGGGAAAYASPNEGGSAVYGEAAAAHTSITNVDYAPLDGGNTTYASSA